MPIPPVSATETTTPAQSAKSSITANSEMFLNLLVTQLKNQDPSSPMDSTAMMNQITQMSMMEQLVNLSKLSEEGFALNMRDAAASLIGRQVSYTDPDGTEVTGIAKSISYSNTIPTVNVDGHAVSLDAITGVTE